MQPSSTLCRDRAAHHQALAGTTTLDNIRLVANAAAAAWAKEGVAAGLREDRKLRAGAFVETCAAASEPTPADLHGLSENPDRGYAAAGA